MPVVMPIVFGPQVCSSLDPGGGAEREWLVTDGLGGYAMGTVSGLRTRRYHGLLMVSGPQPNIRHLGLAALDPVLSLPSGTRVRLGVHQWASGVVDPDGHRFLERFELVDGLPRWRWRVGDVVVERELAMAAGRPGVAVVHRLLAAPYRVHLALEALCTWRDGHGERSAGNGELGAAATADGVVIAGAYRLAGPGWEPAGQWYYGAYARQEATRGLSPVEDLWHAGRFAAVLAPGEAMEVSAWAGEDLATPPPPARTVIEQAHRRAREVVARAKPADSTDATLALAADAFVVATPGGHDVVAGYPWFGVWSRDTMTAYEGLFLDTGRAEEGRELLLGYAGTLSEGMLANTADFGGTAYNTVDATLWYLHALGAHLARTRDTDLAAELIGRLDSGATGRLDSGALRRLDSALAGVVDAHLGGTRHGIHVDPADGLLTQGAEGIALTWMDACVDGVPVTPRTGKPVEVNALWIDGLAALAELRKAAGRDVDDVLALRERACAAFLARFPSPAGWLYDVIDGPSGDDATLRPNQLLAYSLPNGPMPPGAAGVLAAVGAALVTPLGLRTRPPGDEAYRGEHRGGSAERDRAYHEGTVWPWLIGPYVDAVLACPGPDSPGRLPREVWSLLSVIESHLSEWGLGSVSETADGDPPHRATGCPFQAWSVAEVLRVRRTVGRAFSV